MDGENIYFNQKFDLIVSNAVSLTLGMFRLLEKNN
jgi:hypothetical protein